MTEASQSGAAWPSIAGLGPEDLDALDVAATRLGAPGRLGWGRTLALRVLAVVL